jgi:hypothetical protein
LRTSAGVPLKVTRSFSKISTASNFGRGDGFELLAQGAAQ